MPLYNPPAAGTALPAPFALYNGDFANAVGNTINANAVYMNGIWVPTTVTITAVRIQFSSGGAGHYDTGIYDSGGTNKAPGNLLANAASSGTALATGTGLKTPAFIGGNLTLLPGLYWLAFWCDNATDQAFRTGSGGNGLQVCLAGTYSGGPLPALASSITSLVNGTRQYALEAMISGSWS